MRKVNFEFTATGFIIALILVGMFSFSFGYLTTEIDTEYSLSGTTGLSSYENFAKVNASAEEIKEATTITPDTGILDVIGGYFKSGYSALKFSLKSFELYTDIVNEASEDIPEFSVFSSYLTLIILIGLFLGVGVAVLVKMRI